MRRMCTAEKQTGFRFLVLGKGDYFSRLYYCTSFVVFADNFKLLVECTEPLNKMLYEASRKARLELNLDEINHVLVTHLHGDHSNGIEGYGFYKRFVQHRKPTLYTISPALRDLWSHKLQASMGHTADSDFGGRRRMRLEDYFSTKVLQMRRSHRIGPMRIEIHPTRHYLPCFGFRLFFRGKSLGYSSDTAFDPDLIRFLSPCDTILHETNYGGHTPYSKLLELPQEVKRKMLLVHIPDDFDVRHSAIPVAQEGKLYTI
jgi:ribonuclease BN (tRNA processing enzyme)